MIISDIVQKVAEQEKKLGLYDQKVFGIPLWRIYRFKVINSYLYNVYKIGKNDTVVKRTNIKYLIKFYFISLIKYLSLFLQKKKKFDSIILAYPRLQKVDGTYIDKFTDPIIEHLKKGNFLIFQRNQAGKHSLPRYNSEHVIRSDFIEVTSKFIGIALSAIVFARYLNPILITYKKASSYFGLQHKSIIKFTVRLSTFICNYYFHFLLYKKLSPKRIFLVNRQIFYPIIAVCKKLNIKTYEFQHGITLGWTALYSGEYNENIDPDYFLSFGEIWRGKQFGVPVNRIINIGWAYKNFLNKSLNIKALPHDKILVISEPRISSNIIHVVKLLAMKYQNLQFHIRLHPQEELSTSLLRIIEEQKNMKIVDNSIESSVALMSYRFVIGVRSSVLYEALDLKKKVACINFGGCEANAPLKNLLNAFTLINSVDEFQKFLNSPPNLQRYENTFYSEFNQELFNQIFI